MSGSSQITMQVAPNTGSYWAPAHGKVYIVGANASANLVGNNDTVNLSLSRMYIPYHLTATRLDLLISMSQNGSTSGTWAVSVGIYTRAGSTLGSASSAFSSLAWSSGSTTNSSQYWGANTNLRYRSFNLISWNLTPGEYWLANLICVTNVVGTSMGVSAYGCRQLQVLPPPALTNDTIGIGGVYSVTKTDFPSTMSLGDIWFAFSDANGALPTRQPSVSLYGSF
jgi:hypothetical protein